MTQLKKFKIQNYKSQINHNNQNVKFKTLVNAILYFEHLDF